MGHEGARNGIMHYDSMVGGHGGMFGIVGPIFGILIHVAILVLIVMFIVWLYRVMFKRGVGYGSCHGHHSHIPPSIEKDEAMNTLRMRLVTGSIDEKEYRKIKGLLDNKTNIPSVEDNKETTEMSEVK